MHIIFLDTSVFETENFFKGHKIRQLFELAKNNKIELKLTRVNYNEIIQRLNENIHKSLTAFKRANSILNGEGKLLKNVEAFQDCYTYPHIDTEKILEELRIKLDSLIKECSIEIVEIDKSNSIDVFNAYFENKAPFSSGDKKNEFPDAFSLSIIKEWTKKNRKNAYLVSNDKDFNGIKEKTINSTLNLPEILELVTKELYHIEETEFMESSYDESRSEVIQAIKEKFLQEISDSVYYKLEGDPFKESVDVNSPTIKEFDINYEGLNEIVVDSSFTYEIEGVFTFAIDAEYTDLSSAYYHKEANMHIGEYEVSETIELIASVKARADFSYDFKERNAFFYLINDLEIFDINNK